MDTLANLSELHQVLAIIMVFTGLIQLCLLLAMVLRGGTVTIWWGVISVVCAVVIILT